MTIQTGTVSFQSGKSTLEAYLATPEGPGPHPAVVVIHELFGLNDNIRDIARRFANEGYVALAVDLFAGRNRMVCMFRFMGGMFTNSLNHQGIKDLKAALTYLTQQPGVDAAARRRDRVLHGRRLCHRLGVHGRSAQSHRAVLRHHAAPPHSSAARLPHRRLVSRKRLYRRHGAQTRRGAGRLITSSTTSRCIQTRSIHSSTMIDPNYNAEASADAWQRTLAFFKERLG